MVWVKGLHTGWGRRRGRKREKKRNLREGKRRQQRRRDQAAFVKHSPDSFRGSISPDDDGRRSTDGNRDESFADPRITSARQSPIIRLALSYETIRAFDFYYAPQDRDLITSTECGVSRKVSCRIDALFVMTMGPRNFAARRDQFHPFHEEQIYLKN